MKSDLRTILLCNEIHRHTPVKHRALKLSKCCKIIRDRSNDRSLVQACRDTITRVSMGKYQEACDAVDQVGINYESINDS